MRKVLRGLIGGMVEVYRLSWSCSHSHSVEYHLKDLEVGLGLALALVVASACEKYWAGLANDICM